MSCLHLGGGRDSLSFPGGRVKFDSLFQLADSLLRTGHGRLNVLHIGGSHVQGGMLTARMRTNLDSLAGFPLGGRGMLFPYRALRSNAPDDYILTATGSWQGFRCAKRDTTVSLGLSGACIMTSDTLAALGLNLLSLRPWPLRALRILGEGSTSEVRPVLVCRGDTLQPVPTDGKPGLLFPLPQEADTLTISFRGLMADSLFYRLRGIWPEGEEEGLTYTASGINGASVPSWLRCEKLEEELALAPPNLVIFGIGVNDANVPPQRFDVEAFKANYRQLMQRIRSVSPDCCFLFITNNDCWLNVRGYRRRPNTNTPRVQKAMQELASECGGAVFDAFALMGGLRSSNAWVRAGLQRPDHIHFSRQGYELLADLLYNAMIVQCKRTDE